MRQHSRFFDEDEDNVRDINEKGCYLGFERIDDNAEYSISGTIRRGGESVPALRVKVYDEDVAADDFCGQAFTDEDGRYRVSFSKEDFTSSGPMDFEGLPELYLEIAELDTGTGEFREIKRVDLPQTDETNIVSDLDLGSAT